jgi:hypothetical protein
LDQDVQVSPREAEGAEEQENDDFVPPISSQAAPPLDGLVSDDADVPRILEAPEIEALLMTHRARVPIAVTVAHDYSAVNWRVPRPFVVLGWFWITDAWVSQPNLICLVLMIRSSQYSASATNPEITSNSMSILAELSGSSALNSAVLVEHPQHGGSV